MHPRSPDTRSPAMASFAQKEEDASDATEWGEKESALKARMVEITVGEFRGKKISIWDLLHSKYIPEEKRKEILHLYRIGILTIDQMETVVTGIVNRTEEEKMKEAASLPDAPSSWEDPLRNHTVVLHVGQFQGQEASLWDLLFSQYIPDSQREELLTKYQSGILSIPDMIATLASILAGREGSPVQDAGSGLASETTLSQVGGTTPAMPDQELERALQMMTANVPVGEFQGYPRSVWELLFSKYVTVEKRQELLQMYRSGTISAEELTRILITLIEETEERSNTLKFPGLRRQVSASELFSSQIIDRDTLSDLTRGAKTVEEITEMDSVKRYLEGTSCIAGVLVPSKSDPSKMQKMTIYEAMWKGILTPGTALVLLEAQAATGFIIDPLKNEKLSVSDAVSAGLVGAELQEKLLSAEKAVTGYNDPYTGSKISLFQAMNKGLIVKDHGIRLLEAQIATGGIIDPVHSHRLPVEMAYQRGYFDEEMNQILSDPTDDTKGFFDPNTHENLTYMKLRLRCIPDPDSGLLMLHLMEKGSLFFALNDNTRKTLQSAKTTVGVGIFQGQEVSAWDLLFSRYIPPHKRQELLRQYKAGTITLQDVIQILTAIVTETEERNTRHKQPPSPAKRGSLRPDATHPSQEETWEKTLKTTATNMPAGEHQGQQVFVWDLLFSSYITEEKRRELLELYRSGMLPIDRLITILTTLVMKKESTNRKLDIKVRSPSHERAADEEAHVSPSSGPENWETSLRSHHIQVPLGELQSQQLSLWDALFSQFVPDNEREELLSNYRNGSLSLQELTETLASFFAETTKDPDTPSPAIDSLAEEAVEDASDATEWGEKESALKARMVEITLGEFRGKKISIWDLLHSKYIPEEKRKEILHLYRTGILTIDQMETVVTGIVNRTEEEKMKEAASLPDAPSSWEDPLRNHTVVLHVGEFQEEASLWDLLFSQYVPEGKREELLSNYREGLLTVEKLTELLLAESTAIVSGHPSVLETPRTAMASFAEEKEGKDADTSEQGETKKALKARMIEITAGEFHGQKVSVWDLIHSKYIPEDKRKELLQLCESGILTVDQMETVVTGIVSRTEEEKANAAASGVSCGPVVSGEGEGAQSSYYDLLQHTLRLENIDVTIREIQDQKSSVWDPFFSQFVSNIRTEEVVHRHGVPALSVKESIRSITTVITETESMPFAVGGRAKGDIMSPDISKASASQCQAETENALRSRMLKGSFGEVFDQQVSLWDVLHCEYIPEEKRKDLLDLFKTGMLTIDQLETIVTTILNKIAEENRREGPHSILHSELLEDSLQNHTVVLQAGDFQGQETSLRDLLFSQYIPQNKREELLISYRKGRISLEQLTEILASLFAETTVRVSGHPRGPDIPRPATASFEEEEEDEKEEEDASDVTEQGETERALKARMVEIAVGELHGKKISIWDLLHSKYIPEEKRKEILHLYRTGILTIDQVETVVTGIINRTEEEKTKEAASGVSGATEEGETERALKARMVEIAVGEFHGKKISIWDLLHSKYIPEEKRKEILHLYRTGILTIDQMETVVTGIVNRTEEEKTKEAASGVSGATEEGETERALKARMVEITVGEFHGKKVSIWDLLHSKYIPEEKRKEILHLYRTGILTIDQVETVVTGIVNRTEEEKMKEAASGVSGATEEGETERALKARMVEINVGEFHGKKISIWDLLHSKYIPEEKRKEILHLYRTGILTIDQMETVVTGIVSRTEEEKSAKSGLVSDQHQERKTLTKSQSASFGHSLSLEDTLRSESTVVLAGDFHGQTVSCWDLLFSRHISEDKRQELLSQFRGGVLSVQELVSSLTNIITDAERHDRSSRPGSRPLGVSEERDDSYAQQQQQQLKKSLRTTMVHVASGQFKGQKVCVLDLLFSKYVSQDKRQELLELYRAGTLPIQEMVTMVTAMIEEAECKPGKADRKRKMSSKKGTLSWTEKGADS